MNMPSSDFINVLDETTRNSLLNFRDLWFHQLFIATVAVAIGVLLEGPEIAHEVRDAFTCERHKPRWMVLAGLAGWLLIVGGVAGECVFEVIVSRADGQIQTFDNIQLRATEKGVEEATREATSAEKESGENKLEVAKLNVENLRLRLRLADRRLTLEQQKALAHALRPFAGEFLNLVAYSRVDDEATTLARNIEIALGGNFPWSAHWNIAGMEGEFESIRAIEILVDRSASERDRAAAAALVKALRSAGLLLRLPTYAFPPFSHHDEKYWLFRHGSPEYNSNEAKLHITIGRKP